jgi:FkbM family methyltransferase
VIDYFIYESDDFTKDLQDNAHHAGEINFLRSIAMPGMRVIEIGANTGVTAVAIAKAIGETGHLYAFEPVREYYLALMANLSRNAVTNTSAYNLAVSNHTGRITFYKREDGGSGITPATGGDMVCVEATTITEFVTVAEIGEINLLNLDCEGSELFVLQGAEAVLARHAPRIFCELHHRYLGELGQSADMIIGYLHQLGYSVRLVQVEDVEAAVDPANCSHIYATRRPLIPSKENTNETG